MSNVINLNETETQKEVSRMEQYAADLKIRTDADAEEATMIGQQVKEKLDTASAFFEPIVSTAHTAWKTACDRRNLILQPLERAKKAITQKVADWTAEQQRIAAEKQRKADEAAQKLEDKKRQDLLDKAALEKDPEKQENLLQKAQDVYVQPKQVAVAAKPTGLSVTMVWEAQVVDEKKVPVKWWTEVDLARLKKAKTADKTLEVPGIKFVQRAQGAMRAAK